MASGVGPLGRQPRRGGLPEVVQRLQKQQDVHRLRANRCGLEELKKFDVLVALGGRQASRRQRLFLSSVHCLTTLIFEQRSFLHGVCF